MEFRFELADNAHCLEIITLMKETKKQMEHKDWFVDDDINYLSYILEGHGFILLARPENDHTLAGFFIVKFPGLSEDNLGRHLNLTDQQLLQCAHMDSAVVHHSYRGHHLQSQMASLAEQMLHPMPYTYLLATVHPDNCYSLNSMKRCGFDVVKETLLYGGLPRAILLKEI